MCSTGAIHDTNMINVFGLVSLEEPVGTRTLPTQDVSISNDVQEIS